MAVQGSTTGQLENASMEMIKEAIYTIEHDAPNLALVRQFTLPQGRDTMVIPKVGQMTLLDLAETQENTNEMALGMTTTSVSPSIVGGKVIITDTALHDNALDLWGIAGRQVGDAAARRMDTDIIALYPGLQGGTKLGGAGSVISLQRAMNFIAVARTDKYGSKLRVVHHPNVIMRLLQDLTASTGNRPFPRGFSEDRLGKFYDGINLGGVPFFNTGNISRDSANDADGVIMDEDALGVLQAASIRRVTVRDEGIGEGASVLFMTHRYVAFELDDARGAALTYAAVNPATS